jgi:hypothetical protein
MHCSRRAASTGKHRGKTWCAAATLRGACARRDFTGDGASLTDKSTSDCPACEARRAVVAMAAGHAQKKSPACIRAGGANPCQ